MSRSRRSRRPARTTAGKASTDESTESVPPAPPTPSSSPSPSPTGPAPAAGGLVDRLIGLAPWSALLVVAFFALRRLDDFDTWWHLASGRWIVRNGSVPHVDVLSFTVPENEWINLQWLYDVAIYGVWSLGGDSGLVLASTACFVVTFALLARHLGRWLGPVTTTLLLLWVAATVNERFLIRPEMASFPLLAAVQLVLAQGRERPGRLRLLVPLMLLWVNMHSLFILGVAAIACAMAGAVAATVPLVPQGWRNDSAWPAEARRPLMTWGAAAVAATLLNPYLIRALLFPLELMTRIDGSSGVYQSIGEFRAPFSGYFPTFAIGSYQAFFMAFIALAVVAGLLRLTARPRGRGARGGQEATVQGFDLGVLAFVAALAYLSLLARRNVGIFAIGAVPFVGACLGILLARLPRSVAARSTLVSRGSAAAVLAATVGVSASVATNHWYAVTGETHEFGLGTFRSNFQFRAVEFFREQGLPGPTYNDMTAGGYLTWDDPSGQGVYIDGRLEVYDTPFFSSYMANLSNIRAWKKDADERGIQSAIVFHRWGNRHHFMRLLSSLGEWSLVYYDEVAAVFVRNAGNSEVIAAARQAFFSTWREKTEQVLGGDRPARDWQWNIDRYTGLLAYARVLDTFQDPKGALAAYEQAIAGGLPPATEVETRQRAAQYLASFGRMAEARVHLVRAAEVDPASQSTRAMLARLDEISR